MVCEYFGVLQTEISRNTAFLGIGAVTNFVHAS